MNKTGKQREGMNNNNADDYYIINNDKNNKNRKHTPESKDNHKQHRVKRRTHFESK